MTFGILRLGDAVQRWLRHPEPSSWSYKSTIKEKVSLNIFLVCQKSINAKRYVDIAARAYERYVNFLDFLH